MEPTITLPMFGTDSVWAPPNLSELPSWKDVPRIGIDTETKDVGIQSKRGIGVRFKGSFLAGVSFAFDEDHKYYLPLRHENDPMNLDIRLEILSLV